MNTIDIIGLGITAGSIIIFLLVIFLHPRFRKYAGITEYKETRAKYEPQTEKKETTCEAETTITRIIGKLVGTGLSLYVFNVVIQEVTQTFIEEGAVEYATAMVSLATNMIPILGVLFVISTIVQEYFEWEKEQKIPKERKEPKEKEGIEEYKEIRKKYETNKEATETHKTATEVRRKRK